MATIKSRQILADRQNNPWKPMALKHRQVAERNRAIDYVQNPIGIVGGVVANAIQKVVTGEVLSGTKLDGLSLSSGTLSYTKLWRYRLLMKGDNGMEKSQYSPRPSITSTLADALPFIMGKENELDRINHHTTRPESLSDAQLRYPTEEVVKIISRRHQVNFTPSGINYVKDKFDALERYKNKGKALRNSIIIINISSTPYQSITLQNRPDEINFDSKSSWASVQSMGRNVPFMMYVGGEETLSFDISWYANDPKRRDEVLWKCKLLESWTKADGYLASPPLLLIKWGKSDVFKNTDYFILESARYVLRNFQDRARNPNEQNPYSNSLDLELNPSTATQSLVFKKVSMDNPAYLDMIPSDKLAGINGIRVNQTE